MDADTVASALPATWEHLWSSNPHGWVRRERGAVGAVSGAALATLNGVWAERVDVDEEAVFDLLDEVAKSGLPFCLQLRPGTPDRLAARAARRFMLKSVQVPLMALESATELGTAPPPERLRIRQITPEEVAIHVTTAARGFGVPEEPFFRLVTPAVLRRSGTRCYVGEIDGDAATTALGVTLDGFVGVFSVATPPEHRGRGFGAAITARVVADGFADGARWSWLQASPAGYGIYARLGFVALERWDCWVSPPARRGYGEPPAGGDGEPGDETL